MRFSTQFVQNGAIPANFEKGILVDDLPGRVPESATSVFLGLGLIGLV
jgi:hypothetical protein